LHTGTQAEWGPVEKQPERKKRKKKDTIQKEIFYNEVEGDMGEEPEIGGLEGGTEKGRKNRSRKA